MNYEPIIDKLQECLNELRQQSSADQKELELPCWESISKEISQVKEIFKKYCRYIDQDLERCELLVEIAQSDLSPFAQTRLEALRPICLYMDESAAKDMGHKILRHFQNISKALQKRSDYYYSSRIKLED